MIVKIKIDKEKCKGCGLCVHFCPRKVLTISKKRSNEKGYFFARVINSKKCLACANCAIVCPDCCIEIKKY